ncbi:hypothetical protein Tco_1006439, partial [Tanacetum coccineum]
LQPNTGKQEKERRTCEDYLKCEESCIRIKCGSISKKKKSNYSSYQDLRSSCDEDMVPRSSKNIHKIIVRREDQSLHKFKEGDFPRLNLHDIEDLLLLLVQKKLSNLEQDVIFDLNVALRMFTRRIVILKRVEDLQLGVESYQKKLNITKPETFRSDISKLTPYTAYKNPQEHAEYDESNTYMLERFNTSAGNPVKEILLKLNLPDHRSILTDSKVTPTKLGRMTKPDSSPNFIANCFIADSLKDGHGVPVYHSLWKCIFEIHNCLQVLIDALNVSLIFENEYVAMTATQLEYGSYAID